MKNLRSLVITALVSVTVIGLGATWVGAGAPAQAHDQLVSSQPADGSTVTEPPVEVELTYSSQITRLGAVVEVIDDSGRNWVATEPAVEGATVRVALTQGMGVGTYEINWRVISSDGHPVYGDTTFRVGQETQTPSPAPTTPTPAVDLEPSMHPREVGSNEGLGEPATFVVLGALLFIVLAGTLMVSVVKRRRRNLE